MFRATTVVGLIVGCWAGCCGGGAFAESSVPQPQFEVASIKPAAADARGQFIRMALGGRLNVTNMPVKELMVIAWRIQPYQITGGPPWMETARYDITAKPENGSKQSDLPAMLQSLLEDRFQLKIHHETKELGIYELVVANKNGKLGPRLKASKDGGCTQFDPTKPPPRPEPGKPIALGCGGLMGGPGKIMAAGAPIANITPMLSRILGRTVEDHTNLTGKFDINLEWTPDESQALQFPLDGPKPPPLDCSGPSIFTALEDQLGLKLESRKGPVDVIVIDRVERPSEN